VLSGGTRWIRSRTWWSGLRNGIHDMPYHRNSAYLWEEGDLISTYPRAQALADGVLVDIPPWAREAGFTIPVAVTAAVWATLEPSVALRQLGQSVTGRAWDLLMILRSTVRRAGKTDRVHFAPLLVVDPQQLNLTPVASRGAP